MSFPQDDKPTTPVVFTESEMMENNKTANLISQHFLQSHVEITAHSASDMAQMIREEKQMYANMGIKFTVEFLAAMKKREHS